MATFGENLRRERELRGVTLLELANFTKISLRHLQALEADRFDDLPGGVFNRGFVRGVARYLKLDEHHWVGEYVRAAGEEPEILARYAPPGPPAAAGSRRGLWSLALLLIVFGVSAYLVHGLRLRRAAEASPVTPSAALASQTEPKTAAPPALKPVSETRAARAPAPGAPAPVSVTPADLRLQVDALEEAWVSISIDGEPLYSGVMQPGETRSFRAAGSINITTGNASAVVLTLNGETLPPLGNPGERKNLTLTARDLKPPTP
jgi:cytoskeletal protein RodZ